MATDTDADVATLRDALRAANAIEARAIWALARKYGISEELSRAVRFGQ